MRRQELHPRTEVINKTQKNHSRKARNDALIWLAATFPQAFDNALRIRPLKAGIMNDILQYADKAAEAGISKSKLREAVVVFTRRIDYLTCLKAKEMRIDLMGEPVAIVTEEEAERAAIKIRKRIEKSIRNAKKTLLVKPSTPGANTKQGINKPRSYATTHALSSDFPQYPERAPAFSSASTASTVARTPAIVVKNKTVRTFDPEAVARLKEKLGLSRRSEEIKEPS